MATVVKRVSEAGLCISSVFSERAHERHPVGLLFALYNDTERKRTGQLSLIVRPFPIDDIFSRQVHTL